MNRTTFLMRHKRLSALALSTVSGITLRNVLPEIHDLTWQTIILKVGLRLGFTKAFPG